MSPSSPSRTSISSTWATMTGASPSVGSSMIRSRGLVEQRARDREHLLLAAGELAAAMVLALGQPRERLVDALDRPGAAPHAGGKLQMLVDAERAPQPPALRNVADAEARDLGRAQPGELLAADADRAAAGRAPAP